MNLVKVFPRQKRNHRAAVNSFDQLFNEFFGKPVTTSAQKCAPKTTNKTNVKRPAINILETDDNFKIELAAPGFSKKDFTLNVENDLLTISGKREIENKEGEKYTRREFNFSELKRSFQLPETVNQEDIKATFKNGVLAVVLAKKEEAKPIPAKTIEVG